MRSIELAQVKTRQGAFLTLRMFANFILCKQGTKCDIYVEFNYFDLAGFFVITPTGPYTVKIHILGIRCLKIFTLFI